MRFSVKSMWFAIACVLFCVGNVMAGDAIDNGVPAAEFEAEVEESPADLSEVPAAVDPDWMRRSDRSDTGNTSHYRRSAFRSMGVMLLLIGVMLAVNYGLRRKMTGAAPLSRANRLKVLSRLRVGSRQEVVVIDWEGEHILLGVGPNFITPLHRRMNGIESMDLEEPILEEVGYGS